MERKTKMTLAVIGTLIALVVLGGLSTKFFKDDNPIEEACEEIIKEVTGVEIDLTPESPENNEEYEGDLLPCEQRVMFCQRQKF